MYKVAYGQDGKGRNNCGYVPYKMPFKYRGKGIIEVLFMVIKLFFSILFCGNTLYFKCSDIVTAHACEIFF